MKHKSFKTETNAGRRCKIDVIVLEEKDGMFEKAVIVQTTRVVPKEEFEDYGKLNDKFPMFFASRQTENHAVLITRSAPVKLSTFRKINDIVDELLNEPEL